ncbi:MAG: hypothetical protein R2695_07455 [Acidimicrobiales bacterium]
MRSVALRLYLAAVFLMPLQLEIDAFKGRWAHGSLPATLLALSVLAAPATLRLRSKPVTLLPLLMVETLSYGVIVAVTYTGEVTDPRSG